MVNKIRRVDQAINFARSIASDLLMYNADRVVEGLKNDDLFTRLAPELEEGRRLYLERVELEPNGLEHYERAINDILVRKAILGVHRSVE